MMVVPWGKLIREAIDVLDKVAIETIKSTDLDMGGREEKDGAIVHRGALNGFWPRCGVGFRRVRR